MSDSDNQTLDEMRSILRAVAHRLAQRDGLTDAGAPEDHPVRLRTPHLRPDRRLIIAGRRIRERLQRVAELLGQRLEDRDRLLAEWCIDVDEDDLLALEVLVDLTEIVDQQAGLGPVVRRQRHHIGKHLAVRRVAAARHRRHHVDLVFQRARHQRTATGVERADRSARAFALHALIGLDRARDIIAMVGDVGDDPVTAGAAAVVSAASGNRDDPAHIRRSRTCRRA